ncbi:GTPase IMAP family member 7-like [Diretmus argenteus]
MDATRRIVLLGSARAGKSSLGNIICRENVFKINHSSKSGTSVCQAETRPVYGRRITVIDTPGFFDTVKSEEEQKPAIVECIVECSPGPHAFLIVLKVEKFTDQENDVITEICRYFTPEVFKYVAVLFTHGDQLPEGMEIQEFISDNERLRDLVEKCGGRCHVIDNKYWNNNQQENYRSNEFQVAELLHTLDKIVENNNGGCYTNEMLQEVERITMSSPETSQQEARAIAKIIWKKHLIQCAGVTTGMLVGAFCGVVQGVRLVVTALKTSTAGVITIVGAVIGGITRYAAGEDADTPGEAAEKAARAVWDKERERQ